jgi:hypothetical protein
MLRPRFTERLARLMVACNQSAAEPQIYLDHFCRTATYSHNVLELIKMLTAAIALALGGLAIIATAQPKPRLVRVRRK